MKTNKYFTDKDFILNDKMLQDLKVKTIMKPCGIYQCDMPETTIEKYVYKRHNEAFNNYAQRERPKCKCIFTLHTKKKSSYVQIFDRNNEQIFSGNSLWGDEYHKTEKEHFIFIQLLHSVENVIGNYGGEPYNHKPETCYIAQK